MLSGDPLNLPPEAVAAVKAYLRIGHDEEDGLVAELAEAAASLCERFTGQALVVRGFTETIAASAAWIRLGATPVRAIVGVERLADGSAEAIGVGDYAIDIDADGDGWVRLIAGGIGVVRASFEAGLAEQWDELPEALRHGIVRMAAHFYMHRDGRDESAPPAAVTALWRPWRRMPFAAGAAVRIG